MHDEVHSCGRSINNYERRCLLRFWRNKEKMIYLNLGRKGYIKTTVRGVTVFKILSPETKILFFFNVTSREKPKPKNYRILARWP